MIFDLALFTFVHVVISLIGIVTGLVVLAGMFAGMRLDVWTAIFLLFTFATSVTGFFFPFEHFTPGHAVGILSLVALAVAVFARYVRRLAGGWRATYVVTAVIALYFNVFVLFAQLFRRVPALKALAPTQSEPPFLITQLVILVLFIAFAVVAVIKFRIEPLRAA